MNTTKMRRLAAGAVIAGALGFASVGVGAGQAAADDDWFWEPPSPGHFVPSPGHIAQLPFVPPPGHIAQLPFVPPPGHWDKPWKWWR